MTSCLATYVCGKSLQHSSSIKSEFFNFSKYLFVYLTEEVKSYFSENNKMIRDTDFHLNSTLKGKKQPGLLSSSKVCMGIEFREPYIPEIRLKVPRCFYRIARLTEVMLLSTNFIDNIADIDFYHLTDSIMRFLEYRAFMSSKPNLKFQTLSGVYMDFVVEFTHRLSLLVTTDSEESHEDLNGVLRKIFGERFTVPYKGKKKRRGSLFRIKKFFCRCFCCTCERV